MASISLPLAKNWSSILESVHNGTDIDWTYIRSLFPIANWDKIHFNSGSAGVMPIPVQEHLFELIKQMNAAAPYPVWGKWQKVKMKNIERLASMTRVSVDELQIVRNTTEALNMIIYGLPLQPGDEVIAATHDYPFALNAYKNRADRDGIHLRLIDMRLPANDEDIVEMYRRNINNSTRALHITHMTHRQGHIMPVKALTHMAHEQNVEVIIDGAHTIAQIDVDLRDINGDYYASSLHKWLNAPHGTGLLYVKKELIAKLNNHPSSNLSSTSEINKFEHIGTRAFHQEIGISAALDFHDSIGIQSKSSHLRQLTKYWTNPFIGSEKVKFHTDLSQGKSCAVSTFSIINMSGGSIVKKLDQKFDIHAKSVGGKWGSGVRVSTNIFTSQKDMDTLIDAISYMASSI